MAEIINFNKARKRRARADAVALATENRVRFGRTPGERKRDEQTLAEAETKLDGARREPTDETTPRPV